MAVGHVCPSEVVGSIAVVGASDQASKIGGIPLDYLLRFGYGGALYAVNPRATEVVAHTQRQGPHAVAAVGGHRHVGNGGRGIGRVAQLQPARV